MLAKTAMLLVAASHLSHAAPRPEQQKRLDNGLGRKPALGWNSWNVGGCDYANADTALKTAKAFIDLGLKDLGYEYVNIDDCWSTMERDAKTNELVPDPAKWPNGIEAVIDEIHGMGLKFGLYGCAGTQTCAHYPGSQGHEELDAKTLARWGVDYWKHDNCNTPSGNTSTWYLKMRDALADSGRAILFSMCQWGKDDVWTWGKDVGNSWRMSDDINVSWGSMAGIAAKAGEIWQYAAPGGFNDLDMMEIGNGFSDGEERIHMGLWAMMKSPIILGTDLTKIKASSLAIIKNADILAINQDSLGRAATTFTPPGQSPPTSGNLYNYWAGELSDGVVVGLVSASGAAQLSVNFKDVPGLGGDADYSWKELYSGKTGRSKSVSADLGNHDMAIFKVTK